MTTSSRRFAAATAGLAAVLSTVALAAPASAETLTKSDPAGDVSDGAQSFPEQTNGDIRRTRVEHGRRSVTVRVEHRDLARSGLSIQEYVRIKTPSGTVDYSIQTTEEDRQGEFEVFAGPPCPGASWRFDYGTGVFSLTVPRGCLDAPRWVKVGLATITYRDNGEGFRVDDAFDSDYPVGPEDLRFSPRVSRAGGAYSG